MLMPANGLAVPVAATFWAFPVSRSPRQGFRQGGNEMPGKHSRRLDLRLPPDHPIFSVPDRERSRTARERLNITAWLDSRLSGVEARLGALEEKLAALGTALARVEEALARLEGGVLVRETDSGQRPVGGFDAAGFFSSFE